MPAHPVTPAFDRGTLDVGDGHHVYWEAAGKRDGKPAVILHGGPGAPLPARSRRMFDPQRYLVVQLDQRNCGRSTPHAAERVVDLTANTTQHLIADLEQLRSHLGIGRWSLWGGSWGTTLALAYAEAHPDRVTELVLSSVVDPSSAGVEWVTRTMGTIFPRQWEEFRAAVPSTDRDGELSAAYARLLQDPDPAVHEPAAIAWCNWEDAHVATVPGYEPDPRYEDARFRLCFARLVTHYWSNACFLEDGALLRDADRLAGIPTVMINGQLDISGPLGFAWQLAKLLPLGELIVIDDEAHGGERRTLDAIIEATNRFARQQAP
jgi:proline iminopeptidase